VKQKSAADRAYDRRRRRAERMADPRLTMVGVPIRETMAKIPFVIVVIALLATGGVGVLYLNTRTDEVGMRTTDSQERAVDLRLQVESLQRDIAGLDSISEIARKAQQMGLVQAVDPAVIVMTKGSATVIGTPRPATSAPAAPAPASTPGSTAPGSTAPGSTAPARTTAAKTTAAKTTAAKTTAAKTTAAKTTAAKTTAAAKTTTNTSKAGR
jgi:hypothetical protein